MALSSNTPYTLTGEQVEDLVARFKALSARVASLETQIANMPVITMTDTDPGEGATLADNHFIGVYE